MLVLFIAIVKCYLLFSYKLHLPPPNRQVSEALNCQQYTDCFNCSTISTNEKSCSWDEGRCIQSETVTFFTNWFESFAECEVDKKSLSSLSSICNNRNISLPFIANISSSGGMFGTFNTYCLWEIFDINSQKQILIRLKKSDESIDNSDDYALQIKYTDNTETITLLENSTYSFKEIDVVSIKFRYFSKKAKKNPPFLLTIEYFDAKLPKMKIIIIVFCTLVGVCMIFCVFFLVWGKILFSRAKAPNRSEIDGIYTTTTSNLNNNINNNIINNQQRNYNDDLLAKCAVLQYSSTMNCYRCTICLEGFREKDKVIRLKCQHVFHEKCIKKWFKTEKMDKKCPNCNQSTEANKKLLLTVNTIESSGTERRNSLPSSERERRFESNAANHNLEIRRRGRSQGMNRRSANNYVE